MQLQRNIFNFKITGINLKFIFQFFCSLICSLDKLKIYIKKQKVSSRDSSPVREPYLSAASCLPQRGGAWPAKCVLWPCKKIQQVARAINYNHSFLRMEKLESHRYVLKIMSQN